MRTLEGVCVYVAYPYPLVLFIAVISKRLHVVEMELRSGKRKAKVKCYLCICIISYNLYISHIFQENSNVCVIKNCLCY
jgi:hypothetical protein